MLQPARPVQENQGGLAWELDSKESECTTYIELRRDRVTSKPVEIFSGN